MEVLEADRGAVLGVLCHNSFPIWHMQLHHLPVFYSEVQHILLQAFLHEIPARGGRPHGTRHLMVLWMHIIPRHIFRPQRHDQ